MPVPVFEIFLFAIARNNNNPKMSHGNIRGTEISVISGPDGAAASSATFMITVV